MARGPRSRREAARTLSEWAAFDIAPVIAHLRKHTDFNVDLIEQMLIFAITHGGTGAPVAWAIELCPIVPALLPPPPRYFSGLLDAAGKPYATDSPLHAVRYRESDAKHVATRLPAPSGQQWRVVPHPAIPV